MSRSVPSLLLACAILSLGGCGGDAPPVTSLAMLEGRKVFAVPTGTVADQFVLQRFPDARIMYFNSALDCALAVKGGKADAAAYDRPILQNIAAKNDGLVVLPELLVDDRYGFAVQLENTGLKNAIDGVVAELEANGTYGDMMKRWFPERGEPRPMPEIALAGENGVLRFGTAAVTEPMSFVDARKNVVGFDVELAAYVARRLERRLEIVDMEFGALLPALIAGKVDMIGAGLSITEERAKKVLFSESYYPSGIAAVVRGEARKLPAAGGPPFRSVDDIRKGRIGVLLGSIHDSYATKTFPDAEILQYQSVPDLLIALQSDKVDTIFYDHVSLKDILDAHEELGILAPNVFTVPIAAGFNRENDALRERFDAFLRDIRSSGVYDDMAARWMVRGVTAMPEIGGSATTGVLRVGVVSDLGLPFTIVQNGTLVGFDVELSRRFAAFLGRRFVPVDIQFGSMLAAVSTNKIDVITCSLMITDERKKQIDFSEPYYESGVSLVAKKKNILQAAGAPTEPRESSLLQNLSTSFHSNMVHERRYRLILGGLRTTVLISVLAAVLGTILGGLVCFMRMSRRRLSSGLARLYISLLRGTPVLVLLMIIYYVVFASVNIDPVLVAVIAFGLNFAAYVSEMFRASIESIDKGQFEAGIAGGFTKIGTFVHIILPQAVRRVLPVYKGEFISLVKMTSIVGYIAVQDLTKASDIIRSRTFDAFFPLIVAAVIYFTLAWLLALALGRIEVSVAPKRRSLAHGPSGSR